MKDAEPAYAVRLSVVVPTYNKCTYLPALLDSLLRQSLTPSCWELVLVNDGSTDDTPQVIEGYASRFRHFTLVSQENRGIGAARNAGIRAAGGELIAILADDYVLAPTYCADLLAAFDDPEVQGVRGLLGSQGDSLPEFLEQQQIRLLMWKTLHGRDPSLREVLAGAFFPERLTRFRSVLAWGGGAMMRRSLFERHGFFDEELVTGEDGEFAYRLAAQGNIRMHLWPQELVKVRFRTRLPDYLRRCYEYARDDRKIRAGYPQSKARSPATRLRGWLKTVLFMLLQTGSLKRALLLLPCIVLARAVGVLGGIRG